MTHTKRVLALLSDGKPHTHLELYALGVIAHSRVADLRKQGHDIACWTANDHGERVSVYQLVGSSAPPGDDDLPERPTPDPDTGRSGEVVYMHEWAQMRFEGAA